MFLNVVFQFELRAFTYKYKFLFFQREFLHCTDFSYFQICSIIGGFGGVYQGTNCLWKVCPQLYLFFYVELHSRFNINRHFHQQQSLTKGRGLIIRTFSNVYYFNKIHIYDYQKFIKYLGLVITNALNVCFQRKCYQGGQEGS